MWQSIEQFREKVHIDVSRHASAGAHDVAADCSSSHHEESTGENVERWRTVHEETETAGKNDQDQNFLVDWFELPPRRVSSLVEELQSRPVFL